MVIVFDAQVAVTPAGKPVGTPIPEAPVVVIVMFGLIGVLTHIVGFDEAGAAVFAVFTVIELVAEALHPQAFVTVRV